jgi:multidrug efflux pump
MWLSDVSVRRPVLAVVVSALLLAFGLISFDRLPLREYPDIDPPIVSVTTNYPGASAAVVENKVTELIEDRIAGIEGIKSINSSSMDGKSTIRIDFHLERDIDGAANDVRDRVSRALSGLPDEADPPEVAKADDSDSVLIWIHLVAPGMNALEMTDYVRRYLQDRFSALPGVSRIRISGQQVFSMRIWIDRDALVARRLTVGDVEDAIRRQNLELPAGSVKSLERDFTIRVERAYTSAEDFRQLVIRRGDDGYLLRLGDIARVELESAEHRSLFRGNGIEMVGMGVSKQSTANALMVSRAVTAEVERINRQLPNGMQLVKSFDNSIFVEAAISEVYQTLFIAAGLVILVIFLFLGDPRSVLVPAVTVPISLVATFTLLYVLGQQVGFAVIATTLVLIAVFVPITFLEGNLGRLFSEFAITMAVAVGFSTLVALTLAPAICSRLLDRDKVHNRLADAVARLTGKMEQLYRRVLQQVLQRPILTLLVLLASLLLSGWLFTQVSQEYAPREDRGVLFLGISAPEGSSFEYTARQVMEVEKRLTPLLDNGDLHRLLLRAPSFSAGESYNLGFAILVLADWNSGRRDTWTILDDARERLKDIPGARIFVRAPRSLGGGNDEPVQFVVGGNTYEDLAQWQELLLQAAEDNPGLVDADTDFRPTKPQLRLAIDRDRAGDLGVSLMEISRTLETLMGSRKVTTFILGGREYDVIVEGERAAQRTLTDLQDIYVRSESTGVLIPLSNLVSLREQADAGRLQRYNRVRAVTLSANLTEDYSLGEALAWLQNWVHEQLPAEASFDFKGESLEYMSTGRSVLFSFALALLVVFLVMAAQFESFVHPFIILLTVPLALIGGLGGLLLFGLTLNIYSQVAMIMLVGLATKNGILIVEFINQLRDQGVDFDEAVLRGTVARLRPIVMTAITTVAGALPLALSSGPGHEARTVIGVVVMSGVASATLITLVTIPVAYSVLARHTGSPGETQRKLERELG